MTTDRATRSQQLTDRPAWAHADASAAEHVHVDDCVLDRAPANDAPIGGLKVITKSGWFAARPSGTEDIYKIYAESFRGPDHLERIVTEAQVMVDGAIGMKRKRATVGKGLTKSNR